MKVLCNIAQKYAVRQYIKALIGAMKKYQSKGCRALDQAICGQISAQTSSSPLVQQTPIEEVHHHHI